MFEEAAITLRRLYGEDASLCLEARATERLAEMMLDSDRAERAYGKRRRFYCCSAFFFVFFYGYNLYVQYDTMRTGFSCGALFVVVVIVVVVVWWW